MSSYNREEKLPESHSAPTFEKKIRHEYLDKNVEDFYFVLVPEVDGYEPNTTSYHIELANVKVKGSDKTWDVRGNCLGKACRRCERNRAVYKKDMETPYKKKSQLGRIFMVYRVYPNAKDGTFRFGSKVEPLLTEYWYIYDKNKVIAENDKNKSKMVCHDWHDLMNAFELAVKDNRDPLDPKNAVVFHAVRKKGSDEKGKEHNRTHYYHTYVKDQGVVLPETWESDVKKRYKFDDICLKFGVEDMRVLVDTSDEVLRLDTAIDELDAQLMALERSNPQSTDVQKINAEINAAVASKKKEYGNYKLISNKNFLNILEAFENKAGGNTSSAYVAQSNETNDGKGFSSAKKPVSAGKGPATEIPSDFVPDERDFSSQKTSDTSLADSLGDYIPSMADNLDDVPFGDFLPSEAPKAVKAPEAPKVQEAPKAEAAPAKAPVSTPAPVAPKPPVAASATSQDALKKIQQDIRDKQAAKAAAAQKS